MAVRVRVRDNKQVIVPIRFTRAVTGAAVADAPDVDDRGFTMGTRPGGWGAAWSNVDTRGAMVGITKGDTVRIRVLREDIDNDAVLYVTSTDTAVVEVVSPAGGGPIPADGIFRIRGVRDFKNRPVQVQVRLGAADGPVLGDLEPHIFRLRKVKIRAHLVTINGVSTNRSKESLENLFEDVNKIWRPCGIQFVYNKNHTKREEIRRKPLPPGGSEYKRRNGTWRSLPNPLGPNGNYATAGTVTTDLANNHWEEFSTLLQIHPLSTAINVYCVHDANEWIGLTYDNGIARPNGYGEVIRDNANTSTLAHELGHSLNIDGHSDQDAGGNNVRWDMWCRRCLMFSTSPLFWVRPADGVALDRNGNPARAHRLDVGYGNNVKGALITVKNFAADPQDNQLAIARRHALNPY